MSWPDLYHGTPPPPAGDLPLRELILSALAEAAINRRTDQPFCADCDGTPCTTHAHDADLARQYENAYNRVAAGSRDWAALAITTAGALN